MPELVPVLGKNDIDDLVAQVAGKISSDYQNQELVLIGVLKGAFIFLSDLVRHLHMPVKVDFIGTASYGSGTASCGTVRLTKDIQLDLAGKDVLVVEDIVDTGLTLGYIIDHLKSFKPKSVKVCAFIDKRQRRRADVHIDYACHTVAEGFLVGYGLDYDEKYRQLPAIYHLKF